MKCTFKVLSTKHKTALHNFGLKHQSFIFLPFRTFCLLSSWVEMQEISVCGKFKTKLWMLGRSLPCLTHTSLSQIILGPITYYLCDPGKLFTPSRAQFGSLILRKGMIIGQLLTLPGGCQEQSKISVIAGCSANIKKMASFSWSHTKKGKRESWRYPLQMLIGLQQNLLNLSILNILGSFLVEGRCPVHCRMFNSFP